VSGLQTFVCLADLVQVERLIHEGLYLAALDEAGYLVESGPLA
jgi:hypothetical protein